jgi:hypothetical protein
MDPVWPDLMGPEYFDAKILKHICNKSILINVCYYFSSLVFGVLPETAIMILGLRSQGCIHNRTLCITPMLVISRDQ